MSNLFKRLERLVQSVISDSDKEPDADYQNAWEELNDFLGAGGMGRNSSQSGKKDPLARDYANLETNPTVSKEELRRNYKRLLIRYHPDRFAGNPEKQAIATEITIKLNESYKRIVRKRRR